LKVFIFSAFDGVPYSGEEPMRYAAIADEFLKNGHEVIYLTSAFSHIHKKFRKVSDTPERLKVILLSSKSYRSNFSIDRVLSYQRLSVSLSTWLSNLETSSLPDLIIGASPPLVPNYILAKFCKKRRIPFIYDIQDLWPEEFLKFSPLKTVLKFILKPYFTMAENIVRMASAVIAVSSDYLDYYKTQVSDKPTAVFYLGTETAKFEAVGQKHYPDQNFKKVILLGNSQAGKYVMAAAKAIQNIEGVKLTVAGLKEKSWDYRNKIKQQNLENAEIISWLDKDKMYAMLPGFDAGLILLDPESKSAFPNRAFTYFAAGLPVLNTISGSELEKCIADNKLGITIKFADAQNIMEGIKYCLDNFSVSEHKRIQKFAREQFARKIIYADYYKFALKIINKE